MKEEDLGEWFEKELSRRARRASWSREGDYLGMVRRNFLGGKGVEKKTRR